MLCYEPKHEGVRCSDVCGINNYKAEVVVSSSMVIGEKVHLFRPSKAGQNLIGYRSVHVEKTLLQIEPHKGSLINLCASV